MIKIKFLSVGQCKHPGKIIHKKLSFKPIIFPSLVAVIHHPLHGVILFDTGYGKEMIQICKNFPESLYTFVTPVQLNKENELISQLESIGISVNEVKTIILSHFHADHIGNLKFFKNATYIYDDNELKELLNMKKIIQVKNAFLSGLLPDDFEKRSLPLSQLQEKMIDLPLKDFPLGIDLFDDQSLLIIPLPGHTSGHLGLIINTEEKPFFLIADAAWTFDNIKDNQPPSLLTGLIHKDFKQYKKTLNRLNQLNQSNRELMIIPCHCQKTLDQVL